MLEGAGLLPRRLGVLERHENVAEVHPEPDPEPLAEPADLSVPGGGRERHGIEIVEHDVPALFPGIGTVAVDAKACRRHLAELVVDGRRAPARGVAVLLELRRERASSLHPRPEAQRAAGVKDSGLRESPPVDDRIRPRIRGLAELPVFEVEQRADDERRDFSVAGQERASCRSVEQRLAS